MMYENHAGLTLTGSRIQVVEIAHRGDQFIVENVDEAFFNESINFENDKETKISALLQGAFNELALRKSLQSSNVSFTLPFEMFRIMQVPYDNSLLYPDLIEEFRFQFSLLFPFTQADDLVIQYIEVDKGSYTLTNTAIVIGLHRKWLLMLEKFCRRNKLKLRFVDNIHTASERALAASHTDADQQLILSLYLNSGWLSAIYSSFGRPVAFTVLPLKDAGEVPVLLDKITRPGGFLNIEKSAVDAAYLAGEELSPSIVESLKKVVKLDFNHFNPFVNLTPGSGLFNNRNYTDRPNSFSPAAGIAIRIS